jgi:hypothetical protein
MCSLFVVSKTVRPEFPPVRALGQLDCVSVLSSCEAEPGASSGIAATRPAVAQLTELHATSTSDTPRTLPLGTGYDQVSH